MSIVSEAQETYKFFTKREFGVSLNTDKMHQIRTELTLGEVLTLLIHKKVKTKTIKKKLL